MRSLIAAVLILVASYAGAAVPPSLSSVANKQPDSSYLPNLSFIGCNAFRVEQTTVPTLIVSGTGLFYELSVTSGVALGTYAVAFDSGVIGQPIGSATYALGLNAVTNLPAKGIALSPKVFSSLTGTDAAATAPRALSVYIPNGGLGPKRYENGLVVTLSDAGASAYGCYRSDAGTNP